MKAKYYILIIVSLFINKIGYSKEIYNLDLEKSIYIAKQRSYEILSLKQDLRIAELNLHSAASKFKTHVDLNLKLPSFAQEIGSYTDSLGNISLYTSKKATYNGELTINQPLPTDGKIYFTSNLNNIDNYISRNRIMTLNSQIGISQPINAIYYNDIRSTYKSAKLAYEQSQKSLKREELDLIYNVSNAFYRLLSLQKSEEIALTNLDRQKEAYQTAKNKYDAGLIREVDALQMEVDLAEAQNNFDIAVVNKTSSMNNFKEVIGISLSDSVIISSNLRYSVVVIDPNRAVELALQNRSEIREQEINLEVNKINIKRQKSRGMVSGNIVAYYERIGTDISMMDNSIRNSFNNSLSNFEKRPENFGIGLNINIPIIDWGENRSLVKAAEARQQQILYRQEAVKRSIESEVRNLAADLNSSLKRLQLLEQNVKVAEKSFEIVRSRFANGDIDSQSMALERERLNRAYTSHLSAYINYQLLLADLMRRTFYDFENNKRIDS